MSAASPPQSPVKTSNTPPFSTSPPGSDRERTLSQSSSGSLTTGRRRTSSFGSYTRVVVVAIDQSDSSRYAFDWYLHHIWRTDDLIVLVHCPEAPRLPTFSLKSGISPPLEDWKKILDDMNTKSRQLEEDYEGTCAIKKLKHKVRCEAMKNIGEGICRIAEEEQAELVVMGSKGTSGLKHAFVGSVSEYVMRYSKTPTIVIPLRK